MTSAEIVKSLRCCAEIGECEKCPIDAEATWDDCRKRDAEAADLIERLEKEKAALLEYVKKSAGCEKCKNDGPQCGAACCISCKKECACVGCKKGSKWEWKGLVEE